MSNPIILGTANLGVVGGRETAFALLDAYVALGGTTIDTASVYSDWVPGEPGRSETIIGEWLRARGNRQGLRIVTKGAHPPLGHMEQGRCDPASIRHDVELSLKRLGIEHIDLYFLHRDDRRFPAAEILGTLGELQREGKLGALGCSNWSLARIEEAQRSSGAQFAANQVLGNALCRIMTPPSDPTNVTIDAPMFHDAAATGLELQLYTSQCQGLFDKRKAGRASPASYANAACVTAAGRIEAIAAGAGLDAGSMILAYLIALAPNVRPVVGPRDAAQLRDSYPAGDLGLDADTVRAIAEAGQMQDFLVRA